MTLYAWYYSNKNSTIYTRTSTPSIEDTLYDNTGATITRSIQSVASDYSYIIDDKWGEIHLRDSSKDIIEAQYVSNLSDGTNTYVIKDAEARTSIANKQDTLVSGTNIKTINGTSILGSGNIPFPTVDQTYNALSTNAQSGIAVANAIDSRIQIVNSAEYANITPAANVIYFITD